MTYHNTKTPSKSTRSASTLRSVWQARAAPLGTVGRARLSDLNSPAHIWSPPWGWRACSLAFLRGSSVNRPRAQAHLPTKDSLKTYTTSNSKHEMKIDAFNSCKDENRKLPETPCSFIFHVSFQEYRYQYVI